MKALRAVMLLVALAAAQCAVQAHEMSMAEMQLHEVAPGRFVWQWASGEKRAPSEDLTPIWPAQCHTESNTLDCGEAGLKGPLSIEGVGKRYSAALVKVYWFGGQSHVYTLTAGQPTIQLYGAADDRRGRREIASAYTVLGVEHILSGVDHLLFVVSLLFLVGFRRQLVWTITAFTAAHSLTLASAALGILTLRSPPVEASIALSIVLVAGEALHDRTTLARRWPPLVAFLFGLAHGLGFAGALKDIGLPQNYLATALLMFNVGVELGQLMTVAAAWLLWRALRDWSALARVRAPLLYGIGSVAAYWSWSRIAAIVLG